MSKFFLKLLNLANKGIDFSALIAYNEITDSDICEAVRASSQNARLKAVRLSNQNNRLTAVGGVNPPTFYLVTVSHN